MEGLESVSGGPQLLQPEELEEGGKHVSIFLTIIFIVVVIRLVTFDLAACSSLCYQSNSPGFPKPDHRLVWSGQVSFWSGLVWSDLAWSCSAWPGLAWLSLAWWDVFRRLQWDQLEM